ncbi:hypothetical protein RHMOL_Rhmol10G0166500 [Rhododendron molle]|uniref:Uncharacterized protein n=1 Tax=Rhododendron molle TaxID=49168 RepID=A0ACC0M452_RHOML|nr:hypothetical protein RHMOL_Rhmol10G0166500 [Rhododendron molle]
MADSDLAACMASLEAEMGFYHEEIEQLNAQIARLISTIWTLRHVVSNLQDFAFDQLDDKHDPEYVPERGSDNTVEDSEGNSNGSDDHSDGANDVSGEGND